MRKFISLILSVVLCMSMSVSALAVAHEEGDAPPRIFFTNPEGNLEQQSMSLFTASELEDTLPEDVLEIINPVLSGAEVTPYGLNPPSTSDIWDLHEENYNFTVNMSKGNVYSNYVFTGHQSSVYLNTYDISGNSGSFVGTIMIIRDGKQVWGGNGYLYRGGPSSIFVSGLKSTDLIYFYISVNDGVTTKLDREGSYLTKFSS